jgi:hypothetical protein
LQQQQIPYTMSSDEEGVRRPSNGTESPAHSNSHDSGADQMDEGDDLFGSDGEGGLDDIEYANHTKEQELVIDTSPDPTAPWTMNNSTRVTMRTDTIGAKTEWKM